MTNQQYIEEIIKVAVQGNWRDLPMQNTTFLGVEVDEEIITYRFYDNQASQSDYFTYRVSEALLDPNFFKAIGKVKGWHKEDFVAQGNDYLHWRDGIAKKFYEIILTQDLDHAIEWLYNLIKE